MLKNLKKSISNTNIFRALVALLILFIPMYPKFPLMAVKGTYVAVRLDDIVVAGVVLVWILAQIKNKFPVFKEKVTYLLIAYFVAITISFVNALLVFKTDSVGVLGLNLFRRFEYVSLFFITISGVKTKEDLRYPMWFLYATTFLVSLYGLGQKYLSLPVISTMNEEFSKGQLLQMNVWTRISATFAGHYDLAAYMSLALVIMFYGFLKAGKWWLRMAAALIWVLGFYILTLTASRVSIFAFWGGVVLMLLLIRRWLWIVPVSLLVVFSMVNSKDLNQRLLATIPALKREVVRKTTPTPVVPTPTVAVIAGGTKKVTPMPTQAPPTPTVTRHKPDEFIPVDADVGVARSGEIRFNVEWPRAINALKANVFLGTGLGSITLATDNDYLRLLGESGILGFLTFMLILAFFGVSTLPFLFNKKKLQDNEACVVLLSALIAMMANAVFIDVFEASKVAYLFWIMMGVYYAALKVSEKKK